MHQTKKGNQYYVGMKVHIGVTPGPFVRAGVTRIATHVSFLAVQQLIALDYIRDIRRRAHQAMEQAGRQMIWSIAARPSSYKKHAKKSLIGRMRRKIEYTPDRKSGPRLNNRFG
jgi:IS5 family transposase